MPVMSRALVPEVLPAVMADVPAVPEVLPAPPPALALPDWLPADLPYAGRAALAAALAGKVPGGRPEQGELARAAGQARWDEGECARLLRLLDAVGDPRGRRGRVYPLHYMLALPLVPHDQHQHESATRSAKQGLTSQAPCASRHHVLDGQRVGHRSARKPLKLVIRFSVSSGRDYRTEWLRVMMNIQNVERANDLSEWVNPKQLISASLDKSATGLCYLGVIDCRVKYKSVGTPWGQDDDLRPFRSEFAEPNWTVKRQHAARKPQRLSLPHGT